MKTFNDAINNSELTGFDWYEITENLNLIVNGLIAHYNLELMNLKKIRQTEDYRFFCQKMLNELTEVNSNATTWSSVPVMKDNIEKYSPLFKQVNASV